MCSVTGYRSPLNNPAMPEKTKVRDTPTIPLNQRAASLSSAELQYEFLKLSYYLIAFGGLL
jgi:hypothetical protein